MGSNRINLSKIMYIFVKHLKRENNVNKNLIWINILIKCIINEKGNHVERGI